MLPLLPVEVFETQIKMKSSDQAELQAVTYVSHVEAFATGIKAESSNQSLFGGPIKGSR